MKTMMVIAGTKDAREVVKLLLKHQWPVLATVTTAYGRELLPSQPGLQIREGKLTESEMKNLILEKGIGCVIDASHPYAEAVSQNAISACQRTATAYLRFERQTSSCRESGEVFRVNSFEEAADLAAGLEGNIFLAIGTNHLTTFTDRLGENRHRIYARVLPDSRMVGRCEEAGLTAGNIFALKGPFSEALNLEMMKHCQAGVVVTKESGESGGTAEKIQAAAKMGIPVILVERPEVFYPQKVSTLREVEAFLEEINGKNKSGKQEGR